VAAQAAAPVAPPTALADTGGTSATQQLSSGGADAAVGAFREARKYIMGLLQKVQVSTACDGVAIAPICQPQVSPVASFGMERRSKCINAVLNGPRTTTYSAQRFRPSMLLLLPDAGLSVPPCQVNHGLKQQVRVKLVTEDPKVQQHVVEWAALLRTAEEQGNQGSIVELLEDMVE
jgi:hypothetical protein